ncbi:carbonic anhydrase family protein [Liquorilactobacillus uvarum]|uniref:carbonic anhydrase n=1 Tax=Liquorilactobacillus uvarum DSM 19971 TaxID=1423812 RepID=A0A0R1Q6L5_9LACO|nr:carbonic anhydrase family protein [Liquorilactobacillus uvarum]KRL37994.1 carbonate dehydratase [Liquorilactobacillus uvarum DSM 19971]
MLNYQQQDSWEFVPSSLQSPIAIETERTERKVVEKEPLTFMTDYVFESVLNKGNNLQFNGRGKMQLNGRNFKFQQLHFHIPAEHILNGKTFPMEWHFVHQNAIGQTVVVAFFVEIGNDNSLLRPFYEEKKTKENQQQKFEYRLPMSDLLKGKTQNAYNYLGSLTTPPLSRGVEWWVFQQPLFISESQFSALKNNFSGNAREKQKIAGRKVVFYKDAF